MLIFAPPNLKILFLTTHNLATNPRLVKEIELALSLKWQVQVICFEFNNWSAVHNSSLLTDFKKKGVQFFTIDAGRKHFFTWLQSVAKERCARLLCKTGIKSMALQALAVSRRSSLLIKKLKKANPPHWVIGHNPGALYATIRAAEKFNCRAGFDVEDYHPGEGQAVFLQNLCRRLMQQTLLKMNYVSFAAPLIRNAVKNDLGKEGKHWITVLNYFPSAEFVAPAPIEGSLKLVWFSQNIAAGRGLEIILPVLKNIRAEWELHLYGNLDSAFFNNHLKGIDQVKIHAALPQKELHRALRNYDMGLALEPGKDKNNEISISNKMLAYTQAGLYVLASSTAAQENFLNTLPEVGECFYLHEKNNGEVIKSIIDKLVEIRSQKQQRFQAAQELSWEKEAEKLSKLWQN